MMEFEEIKNLMCRIINDFSPLLPGLRIEFLEADAFNARVRGRPLLPGEEREDAEPPPAPIHSFVPNNRIIVSREGIVAHTQKEAVELRRPLVEGLILREIIYLAMARIPRPLPRMRADRILRRYWPLQYVTLQGYAFHSKTDEIL